MFMFVLSFYLYSMAVKDDCSLLTVECKASDYIIRVFSDVLVAFLFLYLPLTSE